MSFAIIEKTKFTGSALRDEVRIGSSKAGRATITIAPKIARDLNNCKAVDVMKGEGSDAGFVAIVPAGNAGRALMAVRDGGPRSTSIASSDIGLPASVRTARVPHELRTDPNGHPMLVLDLRALMGIRAAA